MFKRKVKRHEPPPDPFPKEEIFAKGGSNGDFGGEDVRGADGRPVYPGCMVKRKEFFSDRHGHVIPESWGRVKCLYRQPGLKNPASDCDITVQTVDNRFFWVDTVRRSMHSRGMNEETLAAFQARTRKEGEVS